VVARELVEFFNQSEERGFEPPEEVIPAPRCIGESGYAAHEASKAVGDIRGGHSVIFSVGAQPPLALRASPNGV